MWNLSYRIVACGAFPFLRVELRNAFHMSMTARRILPHWAGPSQAKNSSRLSSERSLPPNQMGRPRSKSLTTMRYLCPWAMAISSMPIARGAGLPARWSCSRIYSLSNSLTASQSRCSSSATSLMVVCRQRRPTKKAKRLVYRGLSASQSRRSVFTPWHREHWTRRRGKTR